MDHFLAPQSFHLHSPLLHYLPLYHLYSQTHLLRLPVFLLYPQSHLDYPLAPPLHLLDCPLHSPYHFLAPQSFHLHFPSLLHYLLPCRLYSQAHLLRLPVFLLQSPNHLDSPLTPPLHLLDCHLYLLYLFS